MTKITAPTTPHVVDPFAATGAQSRVDVAPPGNPLDKPAGVLADEAANARETPAVDPRIEDVPTDWTRASPPAEVDQLRDDNRSLLEEIERIRGERDALQRDLNDLLADGPSPRRAGGPDFPDLDPANACLALCEVYRVTQAAPGDHRQRYLDAAMRAGDVLASIIIGPAPDASQG